MSNKEVIKEYFESQYNENTNFNTILAKMRKDRNMEKKKILKTVATFVIAIGVTIGAVYAGSVVYEKKHEKVFEEPERIDFIGELKVTQEDLNNIISESEAIDKAKEEIKRYGLHISDDEIEKVEIQKEPNYDKIMYDIFAKDLQVTINASSGDLVSWWIKEPYTVEQLERFTTTKEEIIKQAENKLKEYGFGDEYKLSYISSNNGDDETKSYYWYISFSKEYDGLFNPLETISITIIPQVNFVRSIYIQNELFDNNEILISKEQAIEIAQEKDKIVNTENYVFKEVNAQLEIKRTNPEVYLKENGLNRGQESAVLEDGTTVYYYNYKMNGRSRKVYVVTITYESRPFVSERKYYVDATTGEVVGGEDIFDLLDGWAEE